MSRHEWFGSIFEERYGKTGSKGWRMAAVKEVLAWLRSYIHRHQLPISITYRETGI